MILLCNNIMYVMYVMYACNACNACNGCMYVCVCVNHLNRCETSTWWCFFPLICGLGFNFCSFVWFKIKQGGWLSMQVPAQRRGLHETLISLETSSDVPAILFLWWEEAQPKNLHVDFLFFSNRFKPKPNHSVSCQCLYGFRNLNYCRLRQMEQLHLART